LFVTNASLCLVPGPLLLVFVGAGWQAEKTKASSNVQTKAEINRAGFSGRIGFLGIYFDWANLLSIFCGFGKGRTRGTKTAKG
jgi:hypothetical protein